LVIPIPILLFKLYENILFPLIPQLSLVLPIISLNNPEYATFLKSGLLNTFNFQSVLKLIGIFDKLLKSPENNKGLSKRSL
jgi:hypothetical protein